MATKKKRLSKKKLTKKQIKEMQANVQSDMQDWTLGGGELHTGTMDSLDADFDITYGQLDFGFDEDVLRKKYPALKDAHDHYQNILDLCRTREKEENED